MYKFVLSSSKPFITVPQQPSKNYLEWAVLKFISNTTPINLKESSETFSSDMIQFSVSSFETPKYSKQYSHIKKYKPHSKLLVSVQTWADFLSELGPRASPAIILDFCPGYGTLLWASASSDYYAYFAFESSETVYEGICLFFSYLPI